MRKIKEVFRLRFGENRSFEEISRNLGIGETTAREYVERAKRVGIIWPLLPNIDNEALEKVIYPPKNTSNLITPDFSYVHKELKRKGVTLNLLWKEYQSIHEENSLCYSRYCGLYNDWRSKSDVWMPQIHKYGEETCVDYAGLTIPIHNSKNGEVDFEAQIFVGTLCASAYTFAEATESQELVHWIGSHNRMYSFFGGVTDLTIPDNLRDGIKKADLYEPELNHTYQEMAEHYGTFIVPARVRRPKDKSKVENAVQNVERSILAPLRNQKIFSLIELNKNIKEGVQKLNFEPFQKRPEHSRYSLYLECEKQTLKPLPSEQYELSCWKKVTIDGSYHVNVEGCHYSVPYTFYKKSVEIRYNERIVEVFYKDKQIAIHARSKELYTTNHNHRPKSHQIQAECTPEKLREDAKKIGENTLLWVEEVLKDKTFHLRQQEKKCLGMLRLVKTFPAARLDIACKRGLFYKNFSYKGIKAILEQNLDQVALPDNQKIIQLPQNHDNIRDSKYYA